jgi:hypothetical protein
MGLVSQEPSLFNDTIGATESDVVAAARLANAHTFISSLHQVLYCLAPEQSTFISTGTDVFPVILPQIPESAPPPGLLQGPQISSDPPAPAPEKPTATRIEVCMGGKCKKSGSLSLLQELENKVGTGRRLQVLGEVRLRRHPVLPPSMFCLLSACHRPRPVVIDRKERKYCTLVAMNCHSLADRDWLLVTHGWLSTRINTFLLSGAK